MPELLTWSHAHGYAPFVAPTAARSSEGMQKLVMVTVAQAATSRPPRISATVFTPAVKRVPTTTSQTVAILNAWRRRVGLRGNAGPPATWRTTWFQTRSNGWREVKPAIRP